MKKSILTIDNVLNILGQHISIRDIIQLSWTCKLLNEKIFSNEKIWQQRNLIFQPQDEYWIQQHPIKTIQQLLLKIPRYHGLTQLILDHHHHHYSIPNLFYILDQYAHCVQHIQFSFTFNQSHLFYQHLESFTFHLLNLQSHHQMPLTFQQYGYYLNDYYHQFKLKYPNTSNDSIIFDQLNHYQLPTFIDDPPFESLESLHFEVTSSSSSSKEEEEKSLLILKKIKHIIPLLSRQQSKEIKITTNIKVSTTATTTTSSSLSSSTPPPPSSSTTSPTSISSLSSSNNKTTIKRKRKKQQQTTEEKKEENYYKKIHYLSHQLIERQQQLTQSCHTTYLTNHPHYPHHHHPHSVVSSTNSNIPIIHVMRCKKLSN